MLSRTLDAKEGIHTRSNALSMEKDHGKTALSLAVKSDGAGRATLWWNAQR